MRSEKKEHISIRLRKSIILQLKNKLEFIDVKIMSHVLIVVLMIAIIAATVAWFQLNETVKATGLHLKASNTSDVEVSLDEENWSDILGATKAELEHTYENAVSMVDIAMPAFQNIYDKDGNRITTENSGIMAPGTYGSFSFFVKLVNNEYENCALTVSRMLDTVEVEETLSQEITQLFNGHILCFAKVEGEENCRYIDCDSYLEINFGSFTGESEAKEITVYWVWPYEYEDIIANTMVINKVISFGTDESPAKIFAMPNNLPAKLSVSDGNTPKKDYELALNQLFEWERYSKTVSDYAFADEFEKEKMCSDWYDYADTLIGSYVENMLFHIEVKGVKADGDR